MDMMSNIRASASSCVVCGATLAAGETCVLCLLRAGFNGEQASADPARFGDFEIERRDDGSFSELGRGAMGVTYRAHDNSGTQSDRCPQGHRSARSRRRCVSVFYAKPAPRRDRNIGNRRSFSIGASRRRRALLLRDGAGRRRDARSTR